MVVPGPLRILSEVVNTSLIAVARHTEDPKGCP